MTLIISFYLDEVDTLDDVDIADDDDIDNEKQLIFKYISQTNSWSLDKGNHYRKSISMLMILFIGILLSFSFDWQDISSTTVFGPKSKHFEVR